MDNSCIVHVSPLSPNYFLQNELQKWSDFLTHRPLSTTRKSGEIHGLISGGGMYYSDRKANTPIN